MTEPRNIPREIAQLMQVGDCAGLAALAIELHGKLSSILEERAGNNTRKRRQRRRDQVELPLGLRAVAPERSAAPAVPSASAPSAPLPWGASSSPVPSASSHAQPSVPSDAIECAPASRDNATCPVTSRDMVSPLPPTPPNTSLELLAVATAAREAPWPVKLTAAANKGLAVALRVELDQLARPLIGSSGYAVQAVEDLKAAGVPLEFALARIGELAALWKGDRPPNSIRYWISPLVEAWQQQTARQDAKAAPPNAAPAPSAAPQRSALRRIG